MLLFEVGNRKVLHVGDFRWNKKAMQEHGPLRRFISGQERIDDLYLDTTYCDAKYELPTQDEAIDAAIKVAQNEIESAKRTNTKVLLLFGAYTIGKLIRAPLRVALRAMSLLIHVYTYDRQRAHVSFRSKASRNEGLRRLEASPNYEST
jgi:hypothetical protein